MNHHKHFVHSSILAGLLIFSACKTTYKNIPVLSETECIGSGTNNSMRVKAWGYGDRALEAQKQAKRNAVYDIIFKGIKAGDVSCGGEPIVPEGPQKNLAYFDNFFKDEGDYLRFIAISGEGNILPEDRIRVGKRYKVGMYVQVNVGQLKKKLQDDNLAPKLTDGF